MCHIEWVNGKIFILNKYNVYNNILIFFDFPIIKKKLLIIDNAEVRWYVVGFELEFRVILLGR